MGAALKFKQTDLAKQSGEVARLKVLRGPDLGAVYIIKNARVSIGRGEDNDVVLTDMRASRAHCELRYENGAWNVKDSNSANGIAVNGKASRGASIRTRDTISLGETVLEFASAEAGTLVLVAPPADIRQVEAEQANLDMQRARVQAMSRMGGLAKNRPQVEALKNQAAPAPVIPMPKPAGAAQKDPKRVLLLGAAAVVGFLFLMGNPTPPPAPKPKAEDKGLDSFLPPAPDATDSEAVTKTADLFFKTGFREYRLGNYMRAKVQFENVLQMTPNHRLAKIYLKNSENRIDEEVKMYLDIGRKNLEAGKLNEAKGNFETVLRLMYRDPQGPAYSEAHDQLDRVHKEMVGGQS
ncbi:MAG: FHA domain-containing protein [Oligoflexia bacterium]|nr:FHA domain-containing protein [Oligoflexia bacterium]